MNQTLNLFRLQQIDSQIDRIQTNLETIQKSLDDDVEIRQIEELVKETEDRYKSSERVLKQSEQLVEKQHIKIEQTQSDLYGRKSHSPKELQDLQNDVAALKRHLGTLEDAQIEAMIACEEAEAEVKADREKLKAVQDHRSVSEKDLLLEQTTLRNELERYMVERNAVATVVPPTELGQYDQLRQNHRGVAVAVISDSACGACGSSLNRAQIQSARSSGEMSLCPSCGRILYGS